MCLDCNNSLCFLDILPSLSIHTSFLWPLHLFSNHLSICWSLRPRFSCSFLFTMPTVSVLPCCRLVLFVLLFLSIFLFSLRSPIYVLPYHLSCSAACLLCVYGTSSPAFASFPLPSLPSFFFPPSFRTSFRCLSVRRWSQSSETPSPVKRALECAADGPWAAQQPCVTLPALLWGPLGPCAWSGRCGSATASCTAELARWQVELEGEPEERGNQIWALGPKGS